MFDVVSLCCGESVMPMLCKSLIATVSHLSSLLSPFHSLTTSLSISSTTKIVMSSIHGTQLRWSRNNGIISFVLSCPCQFLDIFCSKIITLKALTLSNLRPRTAPLAPTLIQISRQTQIHFQARLKMSATHGAFYVNFIISLPGQYRMHS